MVGLLCQVCYICVYGCGVVMVVVCMTSESRFVLLVYAGRMKS